MAERLQEYDFGSTERTNNTDGRSAQENILAQAHERGSQKAQKKGRLLGTEWSFRRAEEFQVASARYFKKRRHEGKN